LNDREQGGDREEEKKRDIIHVVCGITFPELRVSCLLLELVSILMNPPVERQRRVVGRERKRVERHH